MELVIIAAVAENNIIGKDNHLLWHIPEDLKRFKRLTENHPVIMGRKTYESIPEEYRPLLGRLNIVLSRNSFYECGMISAKSLEEAIKLAESADDGFDNSMAFIIGGQSVYEQSIGRADRLEITEVHHNYVGDAYFPRINSAVWREINRLDKERYSFVTYVRG